MKRTYLILGLLACATVGQATYRGRVFVDANRNGKYDKGEKLLKDVCVSDGLNVVKTESDGTYSLPGHERERFIFITTPSGYMTDNKHYIRIAGSERSYDFGVLPWQGRIASDGSHQFLQVTDTEIFNTADQEDWANEVRDYAAYQQSAFIVHTGDICYENGLKGHIRLMNSSNMGCPVFYGLGNHDLVKGKYGEELFENVYGPVWYSFDFGSTHYIMTPMLGGDYQPGFTPEEVFRWVKNDLDQQPKDKSVIIFHHDLLTFDDNFVYPIGDGETLDLADYNVKGWFYGHWHNHFIRQQGKIRTVSTATLDKGGIDHSTTAFRVVDVDRKGDFTTRLQYTYIDNSLQFASIANDVCATDAAGNLTISVNAYHTVSPVKYVSYTLTSENDKMIQPRKYLQANTDWNWSAAFRVPESYRGQRIFVTALAQMENGDATSKRTSFIYQPTIQAETIPTLEWIQNVKGNIGFTAPLVADGKVFIATLDEDLRGEAYVTALDEKTGKQLWRYRVRNSVKNRIAYDKGFVFAQDGEGFLYAIDARSGRLKWERKLNVAGLPVIIEGIIAQNGMVYAGTGKAFGAYDAVTGEPVWLNKGWGQNQGATSAPVIADDVVVFGTQWSGLYGNDLRTGKLLWKLEESDIRERGAAPAYVDGLLYVASGSAFFIIEPKSGKVVLRKSMPFGVNTTSTPVVTDRLVIFGTSDAGLAVLDRRTLEPEKQVKTGPGLIYTSPYTRHPVSTVEASPILHNGIVYFGASDGVLYGVDPVAGNVVWKHKVGAPVFGSMTIDGNNLYVADYSGNVYRFNLKGISL